MIKTCEFVSPKHPDKICDLIADSILDTYLKKDKNSRVAVEVMGGHKAISVSGEITSQAKVDIEAVVKKIVGPNFHAHVHAVAQSPYIAFGVDRGGAGDQGIMIGYACTETKSLMPLEYELVRKLCQQIYKKFPFDGKVQMTIDSNPSQPPLNLRGGRGSYKPRILSVVASFQNTKTSELTKFVKEIITAGQYFINPAGKWKLGGFDADSGLSGRKIVIDNYGPGVNVGGGSFSGKDYTKVDRSGAYMARKIAVDLLKEYKARKVLVKLAYVIGRPKPVMAIAEIGGRQIAIPKKYDLSPNGIKKFLKLDKVHYARTANWGHFGRGFAWDK